jgi:hypothetical protein
LLNPAGASRAGLEGLPACAPARDGSIAKNRCAQRYESVVGQAEGVIFAPFAHMVNR